MLLQKDRDRFETNAGSERLKDRNKPWSLEWMKALVRWACLGIIPIYTNHQPTTPYQFTVSELSKSRFIGPVWSDNFRSQTRTCPDSEREAAASLFVLDKDQTISHNCFVFFLNTIEEFFGVLHISINIYLLLYVGVYDCKMSSC